jgi:hypothetical protein
MNLGPMELMILAVGGLVVVAAVVWRIIAAAGRSSSRD